MAYVMMDAAGAVGSASAASAPSAVSAPSAGSASSAPSASCAISAVSANFENTIYSRSLAHAVFSGAVFTCAQFQKNPIIFGSC